MGLFILLAALFLTLVLLRNHLVFKYRMKAINIVYGKHSPVDWKVYQRTKRAEQFYDLRKWTFKQFYPELAGRD